MSVYKFMSSGRRISTIVSFVYGSVLQNVLRSSSNSEEYKIRNPSFHILAI